MTRKQKKRLAIIFVLLVGAAAAFYGVLNAVEVNAYVYGTGLITTPLRSLVLSPETRPIKEIVVEDGQRVEKGEVIIGLEDADILAVIKQHETEVRLAEAELDRQLASNAESVRQHQDSLAIAEFVLESAKREHERAMELLKADSISMEEVDRRKLDFELARARCESEKNFSAEAFAKQITVLERKVELAKTQLERSRELLERRRIVSPIAGVLSLHNLAVGEIVDPGKPVAEVFDDSSFVMRVRVAERQLYRVEPGQEASAEIPAYPKRDFGYFPGKVQSIAPIGTPQSTGEGFFIVEILLDEAPEDVTFRPGMLANARISVGKTSLFNKLVRLD